MVCDVVEIAAGAGLAWARRDGVGTVVAVSVAAVVPSVLSVLAAVVPVNVAVLSSAVSAVAFVLASSSALPASPPVASACACCSAVSWVWMASAMAAMGIVALTIDAHAIAQSR